MSCRIPYAPLFGPFDAHKWNCMFAFHMRIHLKQAEFIRRKAMEAID